MQVLILNRDLKTLFGGVAVAAVSGLLMGGALYPDLNEGEIKAPQIETSGGGPRAAMAISDAGLGVYAGHLPDYVVGTDSLKPARYQVLSYEDAAPPQDDAETGQAADVMAYEAPKVQPARWQDEPREPTQYPSERGNVVYTVDLPAPPAPPAEGEDYPPEG